MNSFQICLIVAATLVLVAGKPLYTTQPTRARITEACVSLDECGVFGGVKVGNFRHPSNSNWFYTCYNDTARNPECQQCGAINLHFSDKCKMCLEELQDSNIIECPKVPETINGPAPIVVCNNLVFCANQKDGMYTDAADKTKFYHCSNQITHCKQCQTGLMYDDSCKSCVDPAHTTPATIPTIP